MVVAKSPLTILGVLFIVLLFGCQNKNSISYLLKHGGNKNTLINKRFYEQEPLAQLINMPVLSNLDTAFNLNKATKIHIYATGEMDINMADIPRRYLFKSDDIELFLQSKDGNVVDRIKKSFVFTLSDTAGHNDSCSFTRNGVHYFGYYTKKQKRHQVLISIPWDKLKSNPNVSNTMNFDAAIGDDDNKIYQKAKVAWQSSSDPLYNPKVLGNIVFTENLNPDSNQKTVQSLHRSKRNPVDSVSWADIPIYPIKNLVFGHISDKNDLTASIQSYWDDKQLNFLIKVNDAQNGQAEIKNILNSPTFHDYGWIEDAKGHTVWKMHAMHSKYAGGSKKNQQVDTVITLKPGKYKLKYNTDESHSWNSWDDQPPLTVFYGIVLYKQ